MTQFMYKYASSWTERSRRSAIDKLRKKNGEPLGTYGYTALGTLGGGLLAYLLAKRMGFNTTKGQLLTALAGAGLGGLGTLGAVKLLRDSHGESLSDRMVASDAGLRYYGEDLDVSGVPARAMIDVGLAGVAGGAGRYAAADRLADWARGKGIKHDERMSSGAFSDASKIYNNLKGKAGITDVLSQEYGTARNQLNSLYDRLTQNNASLTGKVNEAKAHLNTAVEYRNAANQARSGRSIEQMRNKYRTRVGFGSAILGLLAGEGINSLLH